ncbi:hypothetical protein [Streptomyces sp. NBC_01176]|uniref:hypothetical protein n=1 Tax=Streptomyces sp. NBC_01176 TaxID=2903760 RepID=UPI002F910E8D|nr:hypothetical protein OG199_44520 [Streptomyces sp. NBC_01176]
MPRFRPVSGVLLTILESGEMLFHAPGGNWSLCPPEATAMWLALQEQGGNAHAAADRLAGVWGLNPAVIHQELMQRVDEWNLAGLLVPCAD